MNWAATKNSFFTSFRMTITANSVKRLIVTYRPVTLIILDGWGVEENPEGSAESRASIPFYRSLIDRYTNAKLVASGEEVGLPEGQMGNSEVGHLNIGAGRIVYQDYTRINIAIRNGELETNPALASVMEGVKASGGVLHFMGLLSDGGVHSDIRHLYALIKTAYARGCSRMAVHAFMDGRDTPPKSGFSYMEALESFISSEGLSESVRVATVSGRFYAMDRDNRWERVQKAYDAITGGKGSTAASGSEAVSYAYSQGETDEFITPTVINGGDGPAGILKDGDAVVFFNFRTDRAREITRALAIDGFTGFDRQARPRLSGYVCMTEYDETFGLPVAFPPHRLKDIFGEVISRLGLRQLRIAETEKYPHVTYFFNGGEEHPFDGEDRVMVPSPKDVPTYDLKPQMSAYEVTDEMLLRLASGVYDVIILNYANPDMVGHTGVMDAAVKACEVVDGCLARVVPAIEAAGGITFICADHGNVEKMVDPGTGGPFTAHTCGRVPLILAREGYALKQSGKLADIAPTMLDLMGIEKPAAMTGESLLIKG